MESDLTSSQPYGTIVSDATGTKQGEVVYKEEALIHDLYTVDPAAGSIPSALTKDLGYVMIVKELLPEAGYTLGIKRYGNPGWILKETIQPHMRLQFGLFAFEPESPPRFRFCFVQVTGLGQVPMQCYCLEFEDEDQAFGRIYKDIMLGMSGGPSEAETENCDEEDSDYEYFYFDEEDCSAYVPELTVSPTPDPMDTHGAHGSSTPSTHSCLELPVALSSADEHNHPDPEPRYPVGVPFDDPLFFSD